MITQSVSPDANIFSCSAYTGMPGYVSFISFLFSASVSHSAERVIPGIFPARMHPAWTLPIFPMPTMPTRSSFFSGSICPLCVGNTGNDIFLAF